MSTYRERRLARADRLEGWADANAARSAERFDAAHQRADAIPFGQPILVGHHSQRRHERDIARIQRDSLAGVELHRKAADQAERAGNIRAAVERAIYDDDPDALERLAAKLASLEADRARYKQHNADARKTGADQLPGYVLRNLAGNITRTRNRIAYLERRATMLEAGNRGHVRRMTSRYPGTCADCGHTIDRGDPIGYYRLTREAVCEGCLS